MRLGLLASRGRTLDAFFPPLVDSWFKQGCEVRLAAGSPSTSFSSTVLDGLGQRPDLGLWRASRGLRRWVSQERLDVLIANTATASALARMTPLPVPLVYFCHGLHWDSGARLSGIPFRIAEYQMLRRTDAVICLNSDDEEWFRRHIDESRILRLPFGVGVPLSDYPFVPPPKVDNRLRLVWAGDFVARKRPELALETVAALRERGVDVSLVMLGDGPLHAAIESRWSARQGPGAIQFPGRQPVLAYLQGADAILHTASWEGLPRILLEGLAAGRPSYAFDVKGVRDVLGVRLAADGSPEALADLIALDADSGALSAVDRPGSALSSEAVATAVLSFVQGIGA